MWFLALLLCWNPIEETSLRQQPRLVFSATQIFLVDDDYNDFMYQRMAESMFFHFKNDFNEVLPGNEYNWDDASVEEDHNCLLFGNKEYCKNKNSSLLVYDSHDENGFYMVYVLARTRGLESLHCVKSSIIITKSGEEKMFREIKWKMFSLFSMDRLKLDSIYSKLPPYTIDKDPEIMIKSPKARKE